MSVRLNGGRLRLELVRRGLDQGGLAKRAKLRPETISRAVCGRRVRSSTLSAIADALMEVPVRPDIAGLLAEPADYKRPVIELRRGDHH
jgi:transcriptional regulator with XRE-family HTH domain